MLGAMARKKPIVGAHLDDEAPLDVAAELGADCLQIFLGPPQSWKPPPPRPDADELRASKLPVYVHAPYLINVCSPRSNVRYGSRKILQQTCSAAAEVDAAAVIVHGGHAEDGIEEGFGRWARTLEMLESDVPVYLENTAGGDNAVARRFDALAGLWDAIAGAKTSVNLGFCFDTCHAHAAGEDLSDAVERVLAIVGKIDLLHVNDSRDPPGTGADRHANIGKGQIAEEDLLAMIKAGGSPAVVETPRDLDDLRADLDFVRAALRSSGG
jgi:deoxyribonuclease IV